MRNKDFDIFLFSSPHKVKAQECWVQGGDMYSLEGYQNQQ